MNAQQNPNFGILIAGIIILFVFGGHLLTVIFQPDDIWWTPIPMKLSVEDSTDRVEVFIKEKSLKDIFKNEKLLLQDDSKTVEITQADISFRFNNHDKMRASQLTKVGIISAMVMASLMLIAYALLTMKKPKASE